MTRSRLDEIVEEENVAPAFRDEAKRIAERAFRHGVERAKADEDVRRRSGFGAGDVQPAPAETDPNHGWVPHYRCHVPGCNSQERRKGQRRKEQWWHQVWVTNPQGENGSVRYVKYGHPDRRSGNDRRKS